MVGVALMEAWRIGKMQLSVVFIATCWMLGGRVKLIDLLSGIVRDTFWIWGVMNGRGGMVWIDGLYSLRGEA